MAAKDFAFIYFVSRVLVDHEIPLFEALLQRTESISPPPCKMSGVMNPAFLHSISADPSNNIRHPFGLVQVLTARRDPSWKHREEPNMVSPEDPTSLDDTAMLPTLNGSVCIIDQLYTDPPSCVQFQLSNVAVEPCSQLLPSPGASGAGLWFSRFPAPLQRSDNATVDPLALHPTAWPSCSGGSITTTPPSIEGNSGPMTASPASCDLVTAAELQTPQRDETTTQAGKRFSSASVRTLNKWLASHTHHPYPTVRDVETIERQTGLSKPQILTWFANARRRKKFLLSNYPASATPPLCSDAIPRDIPLHRPPTPYVEQLDPLERWKNSPPETEPASVAAIARAMSAAASNAFDKTPCTSAEIPGRAQSSINASSVTSAEASESSQSSHASAYSHTSDASGPSFELLRKTRKRRKRHRATTRAKSHDPNALSQVCHRFQCTFCTETFKTKHTWQRHEKSLHLSLEQWECCPHGPSVIHPTSGPVCVYCGFVSPEEAHFEIAHNHGLCRERQRDERIFCRKDHLRQHLRLVHETQFLPWPMEEWKFKNDDIPSRCGFCNLDMMTWAERADHLAEHFKDGKTMADWRGNWGFDATTLAMVENAMPPYLIHYERNSPLPFTTQQGAPFGPASAFELLQLELEYFFSNYVDAYHCPPSDRLLHCEACCIIFGAEILYRHPLPTASSWLRDLLVATEDVTQDAQMRPMRSAARSRFTQLRIHGKNNIFEECKLEASLRDHVDIAHLLDMEIGDNELQREACSIINRMPNTSAMFTRLLVGLIYRSSCWLGPFRLRTGLPPAEPSLSPTNSQEQSITDADLFHVKDLIVANMDDQTESDTFAVKQNLVVNNDARASTGCASQRIVSLNDSNMYRGLTRDLSRFVASVLSPLNPNRHVPTDEELQYQARWIMYDDDDPWNQTPADNPDWLLDFKKATSLL